ncbi:MAG: MoxR family ATPase [Chloroflexi bacterium]|nr:MoxR family ATPase [Chloroflexota bacterium]
MINQNQAARISITGSLAIHGWNHLDPVLLASLATESPLLLVGPHGTAKSLLIERIAGALGLSLRHYNASLLNYDDLVGIPVPEEDNNSLRFITTPGSIWDAEFVFFDEISRCRPDLQNKMFPVIHERRVAGIQLTRLRHRWAAMNPPAPDEPLPNNTNQPMNYYLGSEPLDPALADRFPFVVAVPDWRQLSKDDRRRIVSYQDSVEHPPADDALSGLPELVAACAARISALEVELDAWVSDYMLVVMDLLDKAQLAQSPRRARMLARSAIAVHAARLVLEGEDASLDDSAEIALAFGLPQNAAEVPPSDATVAAVHRQAWEIASLMDDDVWRQILEERDLPRRVVMADRLDFNDLDISRLITQALGAEASEARRIGLGTAIFLAFRDRRELTSAAWEPLAQLAARVLEPRPMFGVIRPGSDVTIWQEIKDWLLMPDDGMNSFLSRLARNYVLCGFPELWRRENWREALDRFASDLEMFGIREVNQS